MSFVYITERTIAQSFLSVSIGQKIVTFEQQGKEKAEYGSNLLNKLASDLTEKYGKGFSRDNLEKMRKFYIFFPNSATVSRNLSWSQYCLLLRIKDELARKVHLTHKNEIYQSVTDHLSHSLNLLMVKDENRGLFLL